MELLTRISLSKPLFMVTEAGICAVRPVDDRAHFFVLSLCLIDKNHFFSKEMGPGTSPCGIMWLCHD